MSKLRVLIVDDSVFFRSQIRAALESIESIEVVGVASNGKIAIEKLKTTPADVVTLDLEMPEMDGLQTLAEIRRLGLGTKVIVFSSHSKRGTEAALDALALGAYDFLAKPGELSTDSASPDLSPLETIRSQLVPKITQFFGNRPLPETHTLLQPDPAPAKTYPAARNWDAYQPQMIVIGSSTGGPGALEQIFSKLRAPIHCPIAIVQHMPPVFTATLASRLARISGLDVVEATHLDLVSKQKVYIAPGDFHMRLIRDAAGVRTTLDRAPHQNSVRPAVDFLFESAAPLFGKDCFALVLTGMGEDGMAGSVVIKEAGGRVMIQDPESCVVFGMPGAVKKSGAYDRIGGLSEIANLINRLNDNVTQGKTA